MEMLRHFFDINTVFFTVLDYPMSYIEFFGTVFNLLCVWLAVRRSSWNWPIGLVGVVLYFFLFYQIRLYSDLFEQGYFFVTGFIGWWMWARTGTPDKDDGGLHIERNSLKENMWYLVVIIAASALLGYLMSNIHLYLPNFFPEEASYPYLDAFTTIMSFAATILMARKKFECWHLWILVDIIGIWLYYAKGVKFIALEYVLFLVMASQGFWKWRNILAKQDKRSGASA